MDENRLLVFDFDGTLSAGDVPVLHYARLLGGAAYAARVRQFLAIGRGAHPLFSRASDGWQAVQALADADDVDTEGPFLATRAAMADGATPISAPDALSDFLERARAGGAAVLLVTNSPLGGMAECLERLGEGVATFTASELPAMYDPILDWLRGSA